MTVKETLHNKMIEHGLFEGMSNKVLDRMIADEAHKSLTESFNEAWDGYPVEFQALTWYSVFVAVIEWMDEEMPSHFARGMFEIEA